MLLAGMESAGFAREWHDTYINSIIECLEYTLMTVISALSKVIHVIVGISSDNGVFWDPSRTWKYCSLAFSCLTGLIVVYSWSNSSMKFRQCLVVFL
jgi:hypothetical protein